MTATEYLDRNDRGPNWKLLVGASKGNCVGFHRDWMGSYQSAKTMRNPSVQACADMCNAYRSIGNQGSHCKYFGVWRNYYRGECVMYTDYVSPWSGEKMGENVRVCDTLNGSPEYTSYELTNPLPHGPQPSGLYPGGRGVLYRVWNRCPPNNAFRGKCSWDDFHALYASANPEYKARGNEKGDVAKGHLRNSEDSRIESNAGTPKNPWVPLCNLQGTHHLEPFQGTLLFCLSGETSNLALNKQAITKETGVLCPSLLPSKKGADADVRGSAHRHPPQPLRDRGRKVQQSGTPPRLRCLEGFILLLLLLLLLLLRTTTTTTTNASLSIH